MTQHMQRIIVDVFQNLGDAKLADAQASSPRSNSRCLELSQGEIDRSVSVGRGVLQFDADQ